MFPNDLWITDPNQKKLFKLVNDSIALTIMTGDPNELADQKQARAVLVSQDMINVYTVNWGSDTVSQFTNGVHVKDIPVGRNPYGICEDPNGAIYVTNYSDNTVTKIYRGNAVDTIHVHEGPRGIVSNSRGRIYVACYLSCSGDMADDGSYIDEIVNSVVTNTIVVGLAPIAVTCDGNDNVWVANYASNTVSKIRNSEKILDVNLRTSTADTLKGPTALVCNSGGVLYVANYLGNTVSIIQNDALYTEIQVSDSPTAIDVNRDDYVYVLSEIDGVADKINPGDNTVVSIPVSSDPCGFGDFTGCATYNCFRGVTGQANSVVPTGGWQMTDLSSEVQQAINMVLNSTTETSSDKVWYPDDATPSTLYPTVKDALDALLNIAPEIKKFEIPENLTVLETGATFGGTAPIQVTWEFNKPMVSADIQFGGVTIGTLSNPSSPADPIPAKGTLVITTSPIGTAGIISLVVTDEAGNTATASTPLEFRDHIRVGAVDPGTTMAQSVISGMKKLKLDNTPKGKLPKVAEIAGKYFNIDCGTGLVPTIAIPYSDALSNPEAQIQSATGFVTGWSEVTTVSFTNGSGGVVNYKIYQLDVSLYGDSYFCLMTSTLQLVS